jgi:hypothetical protein
MSINDICCFVQAWFGVTATVWMTWECTAANTTADKSKKESSLPRDAYFNTFLNEIPIVSNIYQAVIVPIVGSFLKMLQKVTKSTWGLESRPVHRLTPAVCAVTAAAIMSIIPGHISRGKKHLKAHKRSCFPSTEGLSTEEVERIEKLTIDLKEASLQTFCETLEDLGAHGAPQGLHSVFLRAEEAPAFVRALERHHAQLCGIDNCNATAMLDVMANINEDVLSSIVETDVCSFTLLARGSMGPKLAESSELSIGLLIRTSRPIAP